MNKLAIVVRLFIGTMIFVIVELGFFMVARLASVANPECPYYDFSNFLLAFNPFSSLFQPMILVIGVVMTLVAILSAWVFSDWRLYT